MNRMLAFLLVLLGSQLGTSHTAYAETKQYVSDQLRITLRSGQGNQYQILRALESGTPLIVTEQTETGYSHVRLEDGTEGWVRSQYLIDEPIARDKLIKAEARLERMSAQLKKVTDERNQLKEENKILSSSKTELEQSNSKLDEKLKYVTEVSAKPQLELEARNNELQTANLELEKKMQRLDQENQLLRDQKDQEWFIAGAVVVIVGILLGLILPKIRWQRKSSW